MIHSFIWYQFGIHPRPPTGVEKVIFAKKYNILISYFLIHAIRAISYYNFERRLGLLVYIRKMI